MAYGTMGKMGHRRLVTLVEPRAARKGVDMQRPLPQRHVLHVALRQGPPWGQAGGLQAGYSTSSAPLFGGAQSDLYLTRMPPLP